MANGKSFLDFIVDAKNNRELGVAFMQLVSPDDILPFFEERGYDIKEEEVQKIVEVRELGAEMAESGGGGDRY